MERNEILSVCIDTIKHKKDSFSAAQTSDELRNAFIAMNNNSDKLNAKTFRRGTALFDLVEELIPVMIEEGIKASTNPLFQLVDYRNIAYGDLAEFDTEDKADFIVASAARGIQGVRRQRIAGGEKVTIPTEMKVVRVYENLGRLLAGRISFDKFVEGVAKAFEQYITMAAYEALAGITSATAGLNSTYVKSGSITVDNLMTLVEHVEASTGKKAMILGTKTALRKALGSSISYSAEQNSDLYNKGFIGKVGGTPVIGIEQAHKPGTDTFIIADDALWVIASDDKPVKVVNEGDGIMADHEFTENADFTREYVYAQAIGTGVICAAKLGYWHSIV